MLNFVSEPPNALKLGIKRWQKVLWWLESPAGAARPVMASRTDSAKGHLISRQQDAAMISVQSGPESLWLHSRDYHEEPLPAGTQSCWDILGSVQIAEGRSRTGRGRIRAQRQRLITSDCEDWKFFPLKVLNLSSAVKNSSKKLFQMTIKQHIDPPAETDVLLDLSECFGRKQERGCLRGRSQHLALI